MLKTKLSQTNNKPLSSYSVQLDAADTVLVPPFLLKEMEQCSQDKVPNSKIRLIITFIYALVKSILRKKQFLQISP